LVHQLGYTYAFERGVFADGVLSSALATKYIESEVDKNLKPTCSITMQSDLVNKPIEKFAPQAQKQGKFESL
jgi:hypothetical protein